MFDKFGIFLDRYIWMTAKNTKLSSWPCAEEQLRTELTAFQQGIAFESALPISSLVGSGGFLSLTFTFWSLRPTHQPPPPELANVAAIGVAVVALGRRAAIMQHVPAGSENLGGIYRRWESQYNRI